MRINGNALWADLMDTAQFGGTPKGGIRRLTLTPEDKQVREWFASICESLGCTITVDTMGNMFARRPGLDNSLPPITMGSHLDTQPTGGNLMVFWGFWAAWQFYGRFMKPGIQRATPSN